MKKELTVDEKLKSIGDAVGALSGIKLPEPLEKRLQKLKMESSRQ
jgi:hypothetical protein